MKRPTLLIAGAIASAAVLLLCLGTWLWSVVDVQLVLAVIYLILGKLAWRRFRIISALLLATSFMAFRFEVQKHWPASIEDSSSVSSTPSTPTAQPTNMLEIPARG
jgi:uncharacterized membrane protein YccC